MIESRTVIGIIPARGGSKGLPWKNIRDLAGKPLIAWTIEQARKSRYIDRLVLSSENEEIIRLAADWGLEVPFARPKELALDATPGIEPILYTLDRLPEKYDFVVVLQPTSPLRRAGDIDGCLLKCVAENLPSCVSIVKPDHHPYWMYELGRNGLLVPFVREPLFPRRQDLPRLYVLNGAVYVAQTGWLQKTRSLIGEETGGFLMDKISSVDIDDETDFLLAERLIALRHD